jgi:hypothetical protein
LGSRPVCRCLQSRDSVLSTTWSIVPADCPVGGAVRRCRLLQAKGGNPA